MWFQKLSILPPQKGLEIPGRVGLSKAKKLKAMYEAKLEFQEEWVEQGSWANAFLGIGIFFGTTQLQTPITPCPPPLLIGVNILSSLRLGQRYAAHELWLCTREHGRVFGRLLELYVLNVVFFRSCPHRSTWCQK